jgi:hypothetical protein
LPPTVAETRFARNPKMLSRFWSDRLTVQETPATM